MDDPAGFLKRPLENHVSSFIAEDADLFADNDSASTQPYTLVFSANDEKSLKAYINAIGKHLINPSVSTKLSDLSYTLSERRSRHFHRAYVVTQNTDIENSTFVFGKKRTEPLRTGFVFTGQGAQWPQMGKRIIETFPSSRVLLARLDDVLQSLPDPPSWSLISKYRSIFASSRLTNTQMNLLSRGLRNTSDFPNSRSLLLQHYSSSCSVF